MHFVLGHPRQIGSVFNERDQARRKASPGLSFALRFVPIRREIDTRRRRRSKGSFLVHVFFLFNVIFEYNAGRRNYLSFSSSLFICLGSIFFRIFVNIISKYNVMI